MVIRRNGNNFYSEVEWWLGAVHETYLLCQTWNFIKIEVVLPVYHQKLELFNTIHH